MIYNATDIKSIVDKLELGYNAVTLSRIIKRLFDILACIIFIMAFLPFFAVVALIIKWDSPGPVIFKQERCGLKGKRFNMYKFRSMIPGAENMTERLKSKNEISGCMFKIKNDPRITRVGRFIRKTSLDEFPQIINVIKGEMSLVGPRPPLPTEVAEYESWHHLRLSVKPGMTGLWQVSGRNSLGFEEMVILDLKYIEERTFLQDIKIILKTIPLLFGDSRAY